MLVNIIQYQNLKQVEKSLKKLIFFSFSSIIDEAINIACIYFF